MGRYIFLGKGKDMIQARINCTIHIYKYEGKDPYYVGQKTVVGVTPSYLTGYLQALIDKGYKPEVSDQEIVES